MLRAAIGAVAMLIGLGACAQFTCRPTTIVVARKEERARVETGKSGVFTTATGRLEEVQEPEIVREYWVQSKDGAWYRVTDEQYGMAQADGPLTLCQ